MTTTRRRCLAGLAAALPTMFTGRPVLAQEPDIGAIRARWREFLADGVEPPEPEQRLDLSDREWRQRLEPLAYRVLRDEDTERAGTSPLNDEHRPGIYACAGCGLPLFTSEMKFESGTGWPSFFTTIPDVFAQKRDFVLLIPRTEYHCIRCGGHQGHVFDDGPAPTHERWCNNGAALSFNPRSGGA